MRSGEVDPSRGHILTLGDSVAFGLGVNNDETISHYLENDKKINRLKYQVLNISVPGFGIGQYYLNLKRNIDLLNPKLILLVVYTGNDLHDTQQEKHFGISKPIFTSQNDRLVNLNPNISRFSCDNLRTRLRFAKFLIGNCQSKITETNKTKISTGMIINAIRKLGIQKETPTLIVLSPALAAVKFATCSKKIPKDTCLEHEDAFYNVYGYFKKIMESNKIPYVDFLTHLVEYSKEQPISSLYGKGDIHHFSPKGNYILAQTIAKRLATDFDLNKLAPFSRR
jgi:lysophospholipase L1-like esterase